MEFTRPDGKRRVVVTGAGMLTALGRTWDEAYSTLKAGKNCIKKMDEWDRFPKMNTRLACPYTGELPKFPRKKVRGMGRVALLSLVTTNDALDMAGLLNEDKSDVQEELKNGRTGIAFGSCMGSMDAILDLCSMYGPEGDTSRIDSQTYIKCMPQTCAANLSVYYQIRGRVIITDTACTSGSQAVGYAYEAIQDGRADIMIAGGAEELSPPDAAIFDTLGAASLSSDPSKAPKAWDKDRDGLVIGEGSGTLILEDLEHAVNRGAKIYAEVVGFGTNMDGTHITSPNSETQAVALELAIKDANVNKEDIAYVNAHGTATHHGDISESAAVYKVFNRAIPISTTKSYIGHTLGACGAVEAWLTINMLNEGWFHGNVNLENPDPECAPLDYIRTEGMSADAEYAMSNNFAFGGVNTSLIFKKWHNQ